MLRSTWSPRSSVAGRSSRLYADLITEKNEAIEVSAWQYSQKLSGIFAVSGKPAEGYTIEDLESRLQAHINRLASEGPTPEELERVRNQLEMEFIEGLEEFNAVLLP